MSVATPEPKPDSQLRFFAEMTFGVVAAVALELVSVPIAAVLLGALVYLASSTSTQVEGAVFTAMFSPVGIGLYQWVWATPILAIAGIRRRWGFVLGVVCVLAAVMLMNGLCVAAVAVPAGL